MKVESISKSYGKKEVLKNISFDVEEGNCIGILGGNGSGKSTLLGILAGVIKCDSGNFTDGPINLFEYKKKAEIVGYVPQTAPLFDELTAYDNLILWYNKDTLKKSLADGILSLLGINEFLKVPVNKMSGGMKKRLAIGCAVASNPKILLLDEPSAALDLVCKETISNYIDKFKKGGGIVILATHDLQEIPLCDKLYILKNGILEDYKYDGDVQGLVERL